MQSQKKPDIFEDQAGGIENTPSDTTENRKEQNSRVTHAYLTRDGCQSIHHNHKQFSVDLSQECPPKSTHLSSGHLMMLYQKIFQKRRQGNKKDITRSFLYLF